MSRLRFGAAALTVALVAAIAVTAAQATSAQHQSAQRAQTAAAAANPGNAIAEKLLLKVAESIAGKGFTEALTAMGIGGDAAVAAQLAEISKQLERINEQLTTLRAETAAIAHQVNKSDFNNAARDSLPILSLVDHAEGLLRSAAAEPAGSKGQLRLAEDARNYIRSNLLDKFGALERLVGGTGSISPTSILAAGWHVRTDDNFATHQDSVEYRYLIDYYTGYEAAIVQLVATYYSSDPDYSTSYIQGIVSNAQSVVASQLKNLRDVVPVDTAVDVRSHLMWSTKHIGVTEDPEAVIAFGAFRIPKVVSIFLLVTMPQLNNGLTGWTMPTQEQMQNLVKGWNGRPDDFLNKAAGFPTPLEKGEGSQLNPEFWTQTLVRVVPPAFGHPEIRLYDVMNMRDGKEFERAANGSLSQHGYLIVRPTNPGAYVPA
jgi:hypothetical protein